MPCDHPALQTVKATVTDQHISAGYTSSKIRHLSLMVRWLNCRSQQIVVWYYLLGCAKGKVSGDHRIKVTPVRHGFRFTANGDRCRSGLEYFKPQP